MKSTCVFLAFILLFIGCNTRTEELEKQNAELTQKTSELNNELSSRDEYIEQVTQSINEVYGNIEYMKAKEKSILKETGELESAKKLTRSEIRQRLLNEIAVIDSTVRRNQKKLNDLQTKLSSYRSQYAGLRKMVENLKTTLAEREQAMAQLEQRVNGLQTELAEKTRIVQEKESLISQKDAEITDKTTRLNTGYYVVGKRDELEEKGIIKDEGGFMWGLVGSTTVLASGFDKGYFYPIDKTRETSIEVKGNVKEIIPKRDERFYSKTKNGRDLTALRITQPERFWQDNYLVVITD